MNSLLAAPAGPKAVLGLDPGIRTGCKVAVVDATGKLLETTTIYPHQPRNDWQGALATLVDLVIRHGVELISIGNGTASRETDKLAVEVVKMVADRKPEQKVAKIVVSEAGASVYSASAFAAAEFPTLDVSLRGAVSIARRLQDPLAELVKIDPKSIGVGAVSARRQPAGAGAIARCDRRRLRQCRRRGCEYRVGSASGESVGSESRAGAEYRRVSRCTRSVPESNDDS
jgi:transcriptional accessory protein Tex/SPT6